MGEKDNAWPSPSIELTAGRRCTTFIGVLTMSPTVTHPARLHRQRVNALLSLSAGPLLFCAVAFLPAVSPSYAVRCGLGLLLWMGLWWLTRPHTWP